MSRTAASAGAGPEVGYQRIDLGGVDRAGDEQQIDAKTSRARRIGPDAVADGEQPGAIKRMTGGGQGKHMVYLSGVTDHHVQDSDMVDHIVKLVEAKAAEIEAASDAVAHAAE